ncbi:NAD(P)-dependent oxidoreductase [Gordonia zhaorongruii]|uniref:NAD(P)-dependent oxidoreductase n=1 Tax=Gordonia zhaorongruii TaxID=2597659 RepID=UPI00105108BF|nr:NAD(P)-dependent oxidoreductase [Gordonia zhaorongruii]
MIAAPDTPDTHHLVNDPTLGLLTTHSRIVNTARGALVDEDALHRALVDGVFGGAGGGRCVRSR